MTEQSNAAAYDKWFRAQVQAALEDPRPSIPNEEVAVRWSKKRAQLIKQARTQSRRFKGSLKPLA